MAGTKGLPVGVRCVAGLHPRSIAQTVALLVVLGLAHFTAVFESTAGQVIGGIVLLAIGVDVVWLTWRRFGSGE